MGKSQESYQEGWNDALEFIEKSHVKITEVEKSFDKLFDRINQLKLINTYIVNHHKNSIDIYGKSFNDPSDKKKNMKLILEIIEKESGVVIKD